MDADIKEYCKQCEMCQKVNPKWRQEKPPLQNVPVPKAVMQQIGVDIASLPECDGYHYFILAVDYFSKWTEGEPLKDKTAASVANFLFKLICRHSCVKIQINDQGREFVNSVSTELHRLTGVQQRLTSAYHPQANGLVEKQNGTIKNKLLKVLQGKPDGWPRCLEPLLFAHRTTVHRSTKMTPFFLMYGRQPTLPVDVANLLDSDDTTDDNSNSIHEDDSNTDEEIWEFDEDEVMKVMEGMVKIKEKAHDAAHNNIKLAQATQKQQYDKRQGLTGSSLTEGQQVLLKDMYRKDRKGGKTALPFKGPYVIIKIYDNQVCTLKNEKGEVLKMKQNIANLKPFFAPPKEDESLEEEKEKEKETAEDDVKVNKIEQKAPCTYNPVTGHWQNQKAAQLQLTAQSIHRPRKRGCLLTKPATLERMNGDGNCFFRYVYYTISFRVQFVSMRA